MTGASATCILKRALRRLERPANIVVREPLRRLCLLVTAVESERGLGSEQATYSSTQRISVFYRIFWHTFATTRANYV